MYPVSANFHNLIIQDAPTTRVRIFFIGNGVDCTDDNDVQTNGTLLVGAVGDTDSNGRIGQGGITFNNFFNNEKNLLIGDSVSSQIKLTLLNYDGALNGFQFGRCKIYLDVYDSANSAWLTCPIGVFTIEQPTKTRKKLIEVSGFDQMQKLEQIADDWYNALTWTNGITFYDLITGIATELGVSVSATTQSNLLNSTVSFTEPPFDCIEVTYRELLELVAEATGTTARFDKDGALDLKWFSAAQIGGSTYTINTDAATGNRCFGIELVEYQAAQIDALKIKIATDDIGTVVGSGTNQYVIADNMFLSGPDAATITAKATPIYNRLNAIGAYNPIQIKFIADPSIEAGDIINVTNGGTTYTMPVFQQTMKWRGGYVVSVALADGDKTRPVLTSSERAYYRLNSEKVGENNIISKINQSAEQISIQANKLSLYGYTTINNGFKVNMDGTFEANGATINGTINVGGNNDTLGTINVYNSSGTLVGKISNIGLETWNPNGALGLVEYSRVAAGNVLLVTGSTTSVRLNRTAEEAAGTVEVYDKNGMQRWLMHGNSTGPALRLRDANTITRIIAAQGTGTGTPFIQLTDVNGKARIGLVVNNSTGYPSIHLLDSNEQYAGRMYSNGTDTAVALTSNDGTRTATLSTNQTGLSLPNGNATIGGTLSVTGAATLGSTLDVTGNETVGGTLGVTGDTTLSGDLSVAGDESVTGDLTVSGDTTLNGVLDVTKRRCEATLSSAGWYRAIVYNAYDSYSALGYSGEIVTIKTVYTSAVSCQHVIKLFLSYNKIQFLGEESHGTTNVLDKIRYTVNGSKGYVDIHWTSTTDCQVNVSFEVASRNYAQANWVASDLAGVADTPTGETILTTYDFTDNGTVVGNLTSTGVLDVTQRRCSAELSSVGWYRVLSFETNETLQKGAYPFVIDLCIRRAYNNNNNELHKVSLLVDYNNIVFGDEVSLSNLFYIRGIRYTTSSTKSHIDIRYSLSSANNVSVDFTVHALPSMCASIKAESLQSVADAPAGETVQASYVPAQNCIPESKWAVWTNSSPTSGFAAQTVNVDLSRYSMVEIEFSPYADDTRKTVRCPVGKNCNLFFMFINTDTASDVVHSLGSTSRSASVTTSGITFGNGQMLYDGSVYQNWTNRSIPTKIWGIK